MKWRTKWIIACLFTIAVIGIAKLEQLGTISQPITQYVSSGKDFVVLKKWVASIIDKSDEERVTVSADEQAVNPFSLYVSMQPYEDGVIVSYATPIPISAQTSGVVVFTGYTRQSGKTITVQYDDGDEVTYGFVEEFSKLPYTNVKKGEQLASMKEGTMYLQVRRNGLSLDASALANYFLPQ